MSSMETSGTRLRVGSVSFLNAKPLIYGLENAPDVELSLAVPSRLLEGLRSAALDVALLPVIDYQRMPGLRVVPSGGIGCDGETLTVRLFSRRPVEQIRRLACDTDSHTSVALARVILAERYGLRPEFVDLTDDEDCDARLLIGDKVVCAEPAGFEHQLDLGAAWKALTGLPFVFAVWTARAGVELGELPARLEVAKREGLRHVEQIVREHGTGRGWPAGLALRYLTEYLTFDVREPQLTAMAEFYRLAVKHGVLEGTVRAVELAGHLPAYQTPRRQ
jgi:chorismate dehydratase